MSRARFAVISALVALLVLACLPGLTRHLGAVENSDVDHYVALVEHFRGGGDVPPPFAYRVLTPFLASLLPWSALFSLRLVNMGATFGAGVAIDRMLVLCKVGDRARLAGALLFVVSFPVIAYGASGYIEPALVCVLAVGTLAVLSEAWVAFAAVLVFGALVKEQSFILLGVAAARLLRGRRPGLLVGLGALFIATHLCVRFATAPPFYVWWPSAGAIAANLTPGRWLRMGLCLGVPGLLAARLIAHRGLRVIARDDINGPLLAGIGCVLAVTVGACLAARVEGRFVWLATPFTIPLVVRSRAWGTLS